MQGTSAQLRDVRAVHSFDEDRLAVWLAANVEGAEGKLEVQQIAGGASNPTFFLNVSHGGESKRFVMRKKPPGELLASAHQVDREFRAMKALAQTNVPVPNVRALCEDPEVIGTAFYVMDFLDGRIFRDPTLPGVAPAERAAIYDDLNATLAKLHQVDWQGIGLGDYGRPGNYFERQIARFTRLYRGAESEHIPAMEELIRLLPTMIPPDDSVSIAHGDYRLENVMFHKTEPRLIAVLDWELSTIGHPLADLAYNCFFWHAPSSGWEKLTPEERAGIPTEQDYVDAYRQRTGRGEIAGWNFYLAFAVFRLASISQGVYARALSGTTPTEFSTVNGAPPLADISLFLLRRPS